ncbi:glutamine--fructose-6-phosphate transaminase (isomerizing) [Piscirickettsia salmonis]|uniref:glutamine--fructose-6-phosphate transaminase (isomerizing) n=1 Tax=Piscirickettsia salmonis TaxID=1238 RepID=UPI0002DA4E10|nr:glutamine--fructose-6-phosphate transaminase (isomerizing) [Piscirickettsia salmonis]APS57552.1 glutamine--fructose-6-phosphate aminotransferase [Piscirickettsia salmonis]ERL63517.1 glutamine-fructose-6-phosphate transaminase [Piscirickettsia salmonis LF-89 = ATCC VR-1361]PEQ16321.1 glutamine--fructose-6-phosphate transaminase (isomerizing) [Piscirickettsia salmonis]QGN78988.1 Glutamine--fructose-6-phosphate aminotransferase [isomerizing] [Piscirickettsia salmonis]QGN82572.1 Glutamine--fruc
MCGIVGKVSTTPCSEFLINGLKRLEYRGYDSAGVAVIENNQITRIRSLGKVANLEAEVSLFDLEKASVGIAHTRWATHGEPSVENAHPHQSGNIALVHNGIIENYLELKKNLETAGYIFESGTDTEVAAHFIHHTLKTSSSIIDALVKANQTLTGAYAMALIDSEIPDKIYVIRSGSPLVIGLGDNENYISSDSLSLGHLTEEFIYLEEGDIAEITTQNITVYNSQGDLVKREVKHENLQVDHADKDGFEHYMLKEIYEQPHVVQATIERLMPQGSTLAQSVSRQHAAIFSKTKRLQIVACGSSYHVGLVAAEWFEQIAGIATKVDIASEYRYRRQMIDSDTLFLTISQSGETADTLAALRKAQTLGYVATMAVCNVAHSSLVRESDVSFLTAAGAEVSVASTKAFTTQLVTLLQLVLALATHRGAAELKGVDTELLFQNLSHHIDLALTTVEQIKAIAADFKDKHHALFLGRGELYPIAMEGALKLKEISYIHAEAYPAGELKHGPLALVDENMPVIAIINHDELLMEKLISNLNEVITRGGKLYVIIDEALVPKFKLPAEKIIVPAIQHEHLAPLTYNIPLQLLSYYVALEKGENIDQPRNLAKSVTVE